jgi:hypothetical protein
MWREELHNTHNQSEIMTYITFNEIIEQLEDNGQDWEKLQQDKSGEGYLTQLAYITDLTTYSLNINRVIKMHTAAFIAANKLGNLLKNAGYSDSATKAFELDNILDTEVYKTPLVENMKCSDPVNQIIWEGASYLLENEGLWDAYCFTALSLRRLVNWAEDTCNHMVKTRGEDRWVDMQDTCYQVRLLTEKMADEIHELLLGEAGIVSKA